MDILPVERSDKGGTKGLEDLVRNFITLVFEVLDLADLLRAFLLRDAVAHQIPEDTRAVEKVFHVFFKEDEETVVFRQQSMENGIELHRGPDPV